MQEALSTTGQCQNTTSSESGLMILAIRPILGGLGVLGPALDNWATSDPSTPLMMMMMMMFQVEMNPGWHQRKLRDFCKENGIHVSAWSPLGANGAPWGSPAVMENPVLKEIAAAKGKSIAQVRTKKCIFKDYRVSKGPFRQY